VDVVTNLLKLAPSLKVYGRNERDETAVDVASTTEVKDYLTGTTRPFLRLQIVTWLFNYAIAYATSLGESEIKSKISNESFGTSVRLVQTSGTTTSSSTSSNKAGAKKIAVKLLPKGK